MNVLEVDNLCKRLGSKPIIRGVSFSVKEGEIFGFLGPNGAGKTTTIRMLVGLIHPNEGSIKIMGKDLSKEREAALSHIGAVVENPELYGYLTGRENLMQIARIRGISKEKVDEIIDIVGLKDRIDDKVRKYSLGMKQRLGIGAALLPEPKLLILDEPTNGLDPSGILEFRSLIKNICREKKTSFFISSHILSEIQLLCHRVAFINKGIIQSIENTNGMGDKASKEIVIITTKEIDKCNKTLKNLQFVHDIELENDNLVVSLNKDHAPKLIKELVSSGIELEEVYKKHKGLEQRYMELMEGGKN
ncbi:ABC transporter ATP-binding protein [Clostridium sp. MSJ-11]|uniref:ABC transporter ATP-binding protein n=1 Tax=Clostridium mobile TaxID=2841512 RepID=A0ABS6EEQ6_9CLOT|nr:ABC transporter ATP-binding protein [Clostridium mobile]MBU5482874.1 ABC transporter ATP-binding protein [Clostridium mobile]